ncbi:MAG TPA: hypothetical protein VG845_08850, partial [Dehalococcoidia bacterium]|nr:hypothetical protein [Dehalococcoidia bacterium]
MTTTATARTTPAELLRRDTAGDDGLSLWRASLCVWRYSASPAGNEYVACIAESLGRRGLMDFLAAIAPYKGRGLDDFSGVLDDWYLHDRALAGGASEKLLEEHMQSLRDDWLEFGRHRRLFIDILEDRSEATRLVPVLRWSRHPEGARQWLFDALEPVQEAAVRDALGPMAPTDAVVTLSPLAGFLSVLYFLPELTEGWPEWKPLAAEGKSNYMGPAQVPVLALLNKAASLDSVFVERCESLTDGLA